jgi:hypothetical protein
VVSTKTLPIKSLREGKKQKTRAPIFPPDPIRQFNPQPARARLQNAEAKLRQQMTWFVFHPFQFHQMIAHNISLSLCSVNIRTA